MKLLLLSGVLRPADVEAASADPAVAERVTEAAVAFLAAGGVVSLSEWTDLLPAERGALRAAREALEARRVLLLVKALSSPRGAAEVAAPLDGGSSLEEIRHAEVLARAVEAARGASSRPVKSAAKEWNGS